MELINKEYVLASAISGFVRTDENGEKWIRTREVRESILNTPAVEAVPKEDYMALRIASQKVFDSFRKRLGELEERLNTIDIHCIDCKWHEDEEPGMVYCPNIVGGWVSNNFYCGNAERKDEVENG